LKSAEWPNPAGERVGSAKFIVINVTFENKRKNKMYAHTCTATNPLYLPGLNEI
jgi:hypothetical protein